MITDNFTIKSKTSNSSEELEVLDCEKENKVYVETNKLRTGDYLEDNRNLHTIVVSPREKPDPRLKSRFRSKDDFQMARGGPPTRRITNTRGRGGNISSRKVDRENDTFYSSRGRFQESLSKGSSSDTTVSTKSYSENERNKSKYDAGYMVPEDSRISKLLRRLCREDDPEKSVLLCKQLQDSVMVSENNRYIRRAFEMIVESLLDMLHSAPSSLSKSQAAICLGRVGYVLDYDFKRFMEWIFTKLSEERNDNVRSLLMKSLSETLRLESKEQKLKDDSDALMTELQSVLENIHHHEMLMHTVDVIIALTQIYPNTLNNYFRDTVDILVGWHIDINQPQTIVRYASNSLMKFAQHWGEDMEFSVNLLSQFVEDMELLTDDLDSPEPSSDGENPPTPEEAAVRLTLLIRVFNTVMQCVSPNLESPTLPSVTWANLSDYIDRIYATAKRILDAHHLENLIIAANDCFCLLLSVLQSKLTCNIDCLFGFIDMQISLYPEISNLAISSLLRLIYKTFCCVRLALPLDFIGRILGPGSPVLVLRFVDRPRLRMEIFRIYHSILSLKNIPLLQEAYRYMLGDLEIAYKLVVPTVELVNNNPCVEISYTKKQTERILLFYCEAFADIANANNSIIGMWALKPSIMELLAVKLEPCSKELTRYSPAAQYSLLYLTYSHCSRYNHFVLNSDLVKMPPGRSSMRDILGMSSTAGASSPTSGHFAIVLNLLANLISYERTRDIMSLALEWVHEVFLHCLPYLSVLFQADEFMCLLNNLVNAGYSHSSYVVLGILENLKKLFTVKDTSFQTSFCSSIVKLCLLHLNSTNVEVKQKVTSVFMCLPWHITLSYLNKMCFMDFKKKPLHELTVYNKEAIIAAKRYHLSHGICGEMQPQHFRKFMGYLLQGLHYSESNWLVDLFHSCWPLQVSQCSEEEEHCVGLFGKLSSSSESLLYFWSAWEAAQLCVMYKLRTPLGKPQETFTSIEGAVKSLARELSQLNSNNEDASLTVKKHDVSSSSEAGADVVMEKEHTGMWEQRRVRLLLEFVEQLEKVIHNASEGCASAMLPPPKPVRTFFHTNKSTCLEWLTRIRVAVVVVAIHAGQASTAVRHGYCLLQDLADSGNTQGPEFERAVMYVCWALCKLREPEAILGVFAWCKEVSGRKFSWLKVTAEQAMGKFETAAESYHKLLNMLSPSVLEHGPSSTSQSAHTKSNAKSETEPLVLGFMADQIVDCYKAVNNWSDLLKWKEKEKEFWANQNGGTVHKHILNSVSVSHAKALKKLEERDHVIMDKLSKWTSVEIPHGGSASDVIGGGSWTVYRLIPDVNNTVTNIAMNMYNDINISKEKKVAYLEKIKECLHITQSHIEEGLRNLPSEFLMEAVVTNYAASGLQEVLLDKPYRPVFTMAENCSTLKFATSSVLCQVLWWAKYFKQTCPPEEHIASSSAVKNLQLEVARTARKEGNLDLAQRMLIDLLNQEGIQFGSHNELENVARVLSRTVDEIYLGVHKVRYVTEVAKLLYSMDKLESAVQLSAATTLKLLCHMVNTEQPVKERCSRLLLSLAKWLQQDLHQSGCILDEVKKPLDKLLMWKSGINILPDIGHDTGRNGTHVIPVGDMVVGQLLQFGVSSCPSLAKSWNQLAAWCYRWGRRVVDAAIETGSQLSDVDRSAVQKLLPSDTSQESLEQIYSLLSRTKNTSDEDIEAEDFNTSEMMECQLRNISVLSAVSNEELTQLVEIWRRAQKRVYSYYELSATAYFKYLEICGDSEYLTETGDCLTITATLRLLRLIVKHALELQSVLETGLTTTPTAPWKGIIPQLFSRLSHPEPYVRRRVSELLCRVAEDAPHLITFPAVVGAAAGGAQLRNMPMNSSTSRLFGACLSQSSDNGELIDVPAEEDEEDNDEDEDDECFSDEESVQASVLKTCFRAMVDILSKQAPEAISQVQLLVNELRRITLLWDELWLGTLVQHQAEILRRMSQLEAEIVKVDDNLSLSPAEKDFLIAEKHRIILKPLVFVLEQLHAITSVTPETPHEKWFQDRFGSSINEALQKLKFPTNPRRPHESWQLLKQLQSRLQQRAQKRSAYSIRMSEVSPALAELKNTPIAMPGVASCSGKIITIAAVENNIAILPTKTKPKKLVFHGSNGQMYTYLFKGLEDLHLDERIMQFLNIANTMMSHGNDRNMLYNARHYSVIPLGPRSGLISWVDGVTPLFGLYKRWQQREATSSLLKTAHAQASSGPVSVMRPSELFYNKLTPMLKERGISNLDNRKEWPLSVLRQVLTELMEETPKDLLAKELWCHSVNAGAWWHTIRTYSYSVAVMSIIGYIIGLGDRHLDNVLVDLATGEVVHIDYNVCFEKGKTLRVPEKVPFRMTPNIRAALGVTGVEGIFRLACEHVLKVMKKGRETLLTLLEAFVYDPLVDWTPGNETGYTGAVYGGGQAITTETKQSRKELEKEVTRAMFCVRVAEMKSDWLANRDELGDALPVLVNHLNEWLEVYSSIKTAKGSLEDCHHQMALVKEAEASPQHPLYTLAARYTKYRCAKDSLELARVRLKEKIEKCSSELSLHRLALASISGPQLSQWINELNVPIEKDSHLVFDLVKEFLQNAGQAQMIAQCEQSESDLGQMAQQQNILVRTCVDLLGQYVAVASYYPASYLNSHRSVCYSRWAHSLLDDLTVENCQKVSVACKAAFGPEVQNLQKGHVLAVSYQLQAVLSHVDQSIQQCFEKMAEENYIEGSGRCSPLFEDAKAAIKRFLKTEKGAGLAFECVNITALASLNQRYLKMEAAASSAGDCLVDLTSRDGGWFLDEMFLTSALVVELADLIPLEQDYVTLAPPNPEINKKVNLVLNCLHSSHKIFRGLLELHFNFHTIILPETLKSISMEEPSVQAMIQELDDIIDEAGCPLPELLPQLEMHLRFVIMEMDSPQKSCSATVARLRSQFNAFLRQSSSNPGEDILTPGQMLLMGFNGLFEKLHLDGNALVNALESLDTPSCWKQVDQVREAKSYSAPVFKDATRAVLEDIALVKRLITMQDFFLLCNQTAKGITIFGDDHLNRPVRRFTADYVSRQLLGVMSQTLALTLCLLLERIGLSVTVEVEQHEVGQESKVPLKDLCHKTVDTCLKKGLFSNSTLSQASGFSHSMEVAFRRREMGKHLQQEQEMNRSSLQHLQLQMTAHHWLHEDIFISQATPLPSLSRQSFLQEVHKSSTALLTMQQRIVELREQQNSLVASAEQRLRWAAGANPALAEVMSAFETAVSKRAQQLDLEQKLATMVANTCNAILHHELLRTNTPEALACDAAFLELVAQCEQSCHIAVGYDQLVTPAEESLIQMLIPDAPIDCNWVASVEALISDQIKALQQQIDKLQESLSKVQGNIKSQVLIIRGLLSTHYRLVADVRTLLKSMAKSEDTGIKGLQEYLTNYKIYSEKFSALVRDLVSDDLDSDKLNRALENIVDLTCNTKLIYEDLLEFAKQNTDVGNNVLVDDSVTTHLKRPPLTRQDSVCFSPRKGPPIPATPAQKTSRDPYTGKAVQERNTYALSVWRRVRMKLEGRDPDPGRRSTVQEQVDYVIREAMSLDNLALLYEGWTPWV